MANYFDFYATEGMTPIANLCCVQIMSSMRRPCATDSQSTYWNPARMCGPSNCCSATAAWPRRPGTCASPLVRSVPPPVRSTCSRIPLPLSPLPPRLSTSERRAHGAPQTGSGGCVPPVRRSLSREAWRVDVHGAAARHDRHRGVPYGSSRRTDRAVRSVRTAAHLLPILQKSPLPQVSVAGSRRVDPTPPSRTPGLRVLPRCVHGAGRDCCDRPPEQGGGLQHSLPGHG